MRPKRYPYSKKMKKRHQPIFSHEIHEIELYGDDVVVDGILFKNADFSVRRNYASVKVSLEFLAKIKASGNAD